MRRRQFGSCLLMLLSMAGTGATGSFSAGVGTGRWSAAASLLTGREEHTATLLQNGTILVTGGTDGRGTALATAEVYDPGTNRWRPAGSMSTPRVDHSATLLANGKVLVAGGMDASFPSSTLASAELYDSSTNTWSAAPPMSVGRARHTATLLPDGRVLLVGGDSFVLRDGGLFPNPSTIGAAIYDPNGNRWLSAATSGAPLGGSVTLLRDGRVLVAGGIDGFTSEIYDSRQDRWIMIPPMATGHEGHSATLLPDGDVLLIGGQAPTNDPFLRGGFTPTATVETFDPRTDRWSRAASMGAPRIEHTATLMKNGSVLVVGNAVPGTSPAEVYNPKGNAWSTVSAPMHRYLQTATALPDGRIVIIGGYGIESLSSVLIYDPNASQPSLPVTLDPIVIGGLLALMLLLFGAGALSIPSVRQRFAKWRRRTTSEEWVT